MAIRFRADRSFAPAATRPPSTSHASEHPAPVRDSARCWMMFSVLMLCGMTIGFSQLKTTPILSELAAALDVSTTDAAWLTSVFTVAGIVLSVPGASFIARFGSRRMLLVVLGAIECGNVLGAFAASFPALLAARIVEGIAAVFMLPVGIDLINRWFSGPNVGIATGIFMTATPIATFLATSTGLPIVQALGSVKSLWWIVAAIGAVAAVLVFAMVSEPQAPGDAPSHREQPPQASLVADIAAVCSSRPLVALCLAMLCLTFVLYSLITCYPQLFTYYGLSGELANLLTSLNGLVGIPMSVIAGVIVGKTGKPYAVAMLGAVGALAVCITLPHLTGDAAYVLNVVGSAVFPGGIVMAPMFVLAPLLVNRARLAPLATCLLNTFFYLGQLISTPVTTMLTRGNTDWATPSAVLSVACVGLFILLLVSSRALAAADDPA